MKEFMKIVGVVLSVAGIILCSWSILHGFRNGGYTTETEAFVHGTVQLVAIAGCVFLLVYSLRNWEAEKRQEKKGASAPGATIESKDNGDVSTRKFIVPVVISLVLTFSVIRLAIVCWAEHDRQRVQHDTHQQLINMLEQVKKDGARPSQAELDIERLKKALLNATKGQTVDGGVADGGKNYATHPTYDESQ